MATSSLVIPSHTLSIEDRVQQVTKWRRWVAKVQQLHNLQVSAADRRSKEIDSHQPFSYHSLPNASLSKSIQIIPVAETKTDISATDVSHFLPISNSLSVKKSRQPVVFEEMGNMKRWIEEIKGMLRSMKDGEISVSSYDTSWVARVPALDGSMRPQFPKSLDWILKNQLPDGSWGHKDFFLAYDRICGTVGCLVALKTWNVGHQNLERGLKFVWSNMGKMEEAGIVHMPVGFEIAFPALLEDAKELGLHLPYESSIVKLIEKERERKLKCIPLDVLHNYPTTLLHSLEGLHRLVDWNKIVSLQATNGSFLFSPASTASALKYTGDPKCLEYLTAVLEKFDNAVPNVYPVDLFEHMWIVDRLQRLGISRYFETELKESLDYVYRYWTKSGIAWARESSVQDIDDTAMGFRLLRLSGYDVSPDVFCQFKKNDEFFCFAGQTSQAVTGMYNFYRASQTLFPGETILEEARSFSRMFLESKQNTDEVFDKWTIAKGLKGEVTYALRFPWYASLPRIETSEYLSQYGPDDVWIGKMLYKMPYVNNDTFLKLAKSDFNLCQSIHQQELKQVLRWNKECKFDKLPYSYRQKATECYFSIAATAFEPKLTSARLVWTKCCVLTTLLDDFFDVVGCPQELQAFLEAVRRWDIAPIKDCSENTNILFMGLYTTVNNISKEAELAQRRNVSFHFRRFWFRWVTSIMKEAMWRESGYIPSVQEYMEIATLSIALEPIVLSTLFFVGPEISDEIISHEDYGRVMHLLNLIGRLLNDIQGFQRESDSKKHSSISLYLLENPGATQEEAIGHLRWIVDRTMQKLVWEVMRPTAVPRRCKELHLNMAKILHLFYLQSDGFTSLTEMKGYVERVLFTPVRC